MSNLNKEESFVEDGREGKNVPREDGCTTNSTNHRDHEVVEVVAPRARRQTRRARRIRQDYYTVDCKIRIPAAILGQNIKVHGFAVGD